jgi:hypothetical protein
MSKLNPLTDQELLAKAPTLFTTEPHFEVSDKYHFIPTIDIIIQLKSLNWYPMSVQESSVQEISKKGYQKHLVRFRNLDDLLNPQENAMELLLFNSHDRSTAFSISAGIYRFVCANGLVIADSVFESHTIKHIGDRYNDVKGAIEEIVSFKPQLESKIDTFSSIILSTQEKLSFAKSSIGFRFDNHLEIDPHDLLVPHRVEDEQDDLYTTLNIIQENLLRGNISGKNKETGRKFTSKQITSIGKDVNINQSLWNIAEKIAIIKEPSLLVA